MADVSGRFLQLKAINPMLAGQSWETRVAADAAGSLYQSVKGGAYNQLVGSVPGRIYGGTSGAALLAALAAANAAGGGTVIELGKGTYNLTAQMLFGADGIQVIGNGPGSTFINIDDAGGMSGIDAILMNSVLWSAIKGVTFTSNGVARTSGATIKVLGKNDVTANPVAKRTNQGVVEDVDFENQFNSFVLNDSVVNEGVWGFNVNRCNIYNSGANGHGFLVDTPHSGDNYLSNITFYGPSGATDAQRTNACVRYRSGGDLIMYNVNSVYSRYGLLIDPDGKLANVAIANSCIWDNNTRASISLTPFNGGQCYDTQITGGWGYTVLGLGYPTIDINPGSANNADNCVITSGVYAGGFIGARLSGANLFGTVINGADFSACTTGIICTGSTSDFVLTNNMIGKVTSSVPLVGIQIDAGCDHYVVANNHLRYAATPLINTPGDSAGRRIATGGNNVTA